MNNKLWLPETAKELICLNVDEFNHCSNQIETMIFVNQSAVNWLNGELDTGTFTDILSQYEIEPESVIDETEEFVNWLASHG